MDLFDWLKAILMLLLVLSPIVYGVAYRMSEENIIILVDEKQTKYHDGDEKYLIRASTGEVFESTDSIVFVKFDSSDVYFDMKEGGKYSCKVAGWRIPFLSMYRNIIEIQEKWA